MALGKKTGGRDFRPGQGGRKKGSKDKIPRSVKASIAAIYEEVASDNPEIIRDAIVRGLKAPPPKSFPYVNLGALYLDGKPTERSDVADDLASMLANAARLRGYDPRAALPPPSPEAVEAHLKARARPEVIEAEVQQAREDLLKYWNATPEEIRADLRRHNFPPEVIEAEILKRQQERLRMELAKLEQAAKEAAESDSGPRQVQTQPAKHAEAESNPKPITSPANLTDPNGVKPAPSRPQQRPPDLAWGCWESPDPL